MHLKKGRSVANYKTAFFLLVRKVFIKKLSNETVAFIYVILYVFNLEIFCKTKNVFEIT